MGALTSDISVQSQTVALQRVQSLFSKGVITARAYATGTGTWSARFNYAPVDGGGIVGTVAYLDVINTTQMAEATWQTGSNAFIGWWSNIVGTVVTGTGTVEG